MEELTNVGLVEAAEALIENVPEDVVVNAGLGIGKKIGLVGIVIVTAAGVAYGVNKAVKYVKSKKAGKNVVEIDDVDDETESDNENESE